MEQAELIQAINHDYPDLAGLDVVIAGPAGIIDKIGVALLRQGLLPEQLTSRAL